MNWYVYILKCSNGSLYIGVTTNISRRVAEHMRGQGVNFTKSIGVDKLSYFEKFETKNEAFLREAQIKRWTRRKKLALICGDIKLLKKL